MAASTGPILAAGGITVVNRVVFNGRAWDWKPPIATGMAALLFSLAETMIGPGLPRAVAMLALVTITVSRIDPSVPSPAESALRWLNQK